MVSSVSNWPRALIVLSLVVGLVSVVHAETVVSHMHYANHAIPWLEWLQERAVAYEKRHPDVKIDIFVSTDGTGVNQLTAMAAGGALPDVTELALVYGGMFAGRDFFHDLRPYITRDRLDTRVFPPNAMDSVT